MKKTEKKYIVIRHYTRDGLENFGYNIWTRKNVWRLLVSLIIFMGAGVAVDYFASPNSKLQYVVIITMLVFACFYIAQAYRYGKKFYQKVKDLPEPIDLDLIK